MSANHIKKTFEELGGTFVSPVSDLRDKALGIKAFVFDWDGVFTNGYKLADGTTQFSEADAAGINMLRYAWWKRTGQLPMCAIISGKQSPEARMMARRESFNYVYGNIVHKAEAIEHLKERNNLKKDELMLVFDDYLDIAMSRLAVLNVFVPKKATPMLRQYIAKNQDADYITGCLSGEHAVREVCELLIGLLGNLDQCLADRIAFNAEYQAYLEERKNVPMVTFVKDLEGFVEEAD